MKAFHKKTVAAALLPLAIGVVLAYNGSRMVAAGSAFYQAELLLTDWNSRKGEPSATAAQVALSAAEQAIAIYPAENGRYTYMLGQIQQRTSRFSHAQASSVKSTHALDTLRRATTLLPGKPEVWTALAAEKYYRFELDKEFNSAYSTARKSAPDHPFTSQQLVRLGLPAYTLLSASNQEVLLASIKNLEKQNPLFLAELYRSTKSDIIKDRLCRKIGADTARNLKICPVAAG